LRQVAVGSEIMSGLRRC